MKTPDKQNRTVEQQAPEKIDEGRRQFLRTSRKGILGALALSLGLSVSEANADQLNPYYDKIKPALQAQFGPRETHKAELTPEELPIMEKAMNAVSKHFLQPSFLLHAIPTGKEDLAKAILKSIIGNYKQLHYSENGNTITLTKRKNPVSTRVPEGFKVVIQNGIITQLGDIKPNQKALERGQKEWKRIQKQIRAINIKKGNGDMAGRDWKVFDFFSYRLPRTFVEFLRAKETGFGLTPQERSTLTTLENLLVNQPNSTSEVGPGKKMPQFYGTILPLTNMDLIEFAYAAGHESMPRQAFAAFAFNGDVMRNTSNNIRVPKWENGSTKYSRRHTEGIIREW